VRCACPPGPLAEELARRGVETTAIPELKLPSGPRLLGYLRLAVRSLKVAFTLRRIGTGAEVILVNGALGLPAVALARPHASVVFLVHEVIRRPDRVRLVRRLRRVVTSTITVSDAAAAALADAGLAARVVPNGTPWPVPAGPPVSPAPSSVLVVGCLAAITPGKGQHVLIEALSRLKQRDVVVELMGESLPKDGAYQKDLIAQAGVAGLTDRVRFLGHVPDPLDRARGWTAAVLPSVVPEAAPLALLEAMSLGVPVVATDHGGSPEVVGDAGLLVPPGDPDALALAISRLISDDGLRRSCAAAGPVQVAERYALADRVTELLDAIAAVTPPAGSPQDGGRRASENPRRLRRRSSGGRGPTAVIAVPDFDPTMGGTGRQARNQAAGLMARGRSVLVVTRRRQRSCPAHEIRRGIPVARFWSPGTGRIGDKLSVALLASWLIRHRRQVGSVQVVMYPDFVLSAAAAALGRRTVLIWAGLGDATDVLAPTADRARAVQRAVRRTVLNRCHHVALTPAIAAELSGLHISGASLRVIPVPVDTARFRPPTLHERTRSRLDLGLADDDLVVIYTGHFRALKGVDRLVEAFARLVATGHGARLLLVGGGSSLNECEPELRSQVARLGLDNQVGFVGVVDDVERYLWASDVFVLPSRREGMSNSLTEAMACGLACVAGPEAGGDQVLTDGAGVVPPGNQAEHLFRALSDLAGSPDLRRHLGAVAAGRARAMSIEAVGLTYDQLLTEIEVG
jgi:glycosyltransferase involved in cell wall biosynthesis